MASAVLRPFLRFGFAAACLALTATAVAAQAERPRPVPPEEAIAPAGARDEAGGSGGDAEGPSQPGADGERKDGGKARPGSAAAGGGGSGADDGTDQADASPRQRDAIVDDAPQLTEAMGADTSHEDHAARVKAGGVAAKDSGAANGGDPGAIVCRAGCLGERGSVVYFGKIATPKAPPSQDAAAGEAMTCIAGCAGVPKSYPSRPPAAKEAPGRPSVKLDGWTATVARN
jgi:hypothetical protein